MGGNTQAIINSRLNGRIASMMLILSLLFVSNLTAWSQTYQYDNQCTGGAILASDVLANAIGAGSNIPLVDQTGGVLTSSDADIILSTNDENAIIYGTKNVGGGQKLTWVANGNTYNLNIKKLVGSADAPTVIDFQAVDPNPCGIPYNPQAILEIIGGTLSYNVSIVDENGDLKYSNPAFPSNGRLVVNLGSGETINKTYTITTVLDGGGCTADVTGVASINFTVSIIPSILDLSGNPTPACVSGGGLTISLPATLPGNTGETGVSYELQRDKDDDGTFEDVVSSLVGDGASALQWPTQTIPGMYRVIANGCSGTVVMNNTYVLEDEPLDRPFLVTGNQCASGQVIIPNSELGVSYNLYREDRTTGALVWTGITRISTVDGSTITFPAQTADGIYTVQAVSEFGACSFFLSSSLTVINPDNFTLSASAPNYCQGTASNITVTLSGSEPGNSYQLRRDTGTGFADHDPAQGDGFGAALQWTDVPYGTYEVLVETPEGCTETMGNVVISETIPPTATIAIGTDNSKCDGTSKNFNPEITFTNGVAPFTFTISDDKVPANTWTFVSPGGVFSGFTVDPSSTTTYTVTYVEGGDGCVGTGAGSATITVKESPTVTILADSEVCSGQPLLMTANPNITGAGLAITGVEWGNGSTLNAITVTPSTPPATITTQTYTVTATANNNCQSTAVHNVTVNPLPTIAFSALDPFYCEDHAPVPMDATPTGGTYYVNGVSLGVGVTAFDPGNPAFLQDDNTIYYEVTDGKGCTNTAAIPDVDVKPMPTPQINNLPLTICSDAGAQTVYGIPAGGTFNVVGVGLDYTVVGNQMTINPGTSAAGFPYTIEYEYSDGFGCTVTASQTTEIIDFSVGVLTMSSNPVMTLPLCPDDNTDYDLTGLVGGITVTAAGGTATITGPGVSDNGDGTAEFNAVTAGAGQHTITFTYTNNGCSSSLNTVIDVGINMTIDLASSYCEGVPVQTITATPDGGTFSIKEPGGAITSPPNLGGAPAGTEQFSFDPSGLASVGKTGTYEISYTIDDGAGCITTQTWTTTVGAAVDASFTGLPLNVCINDGAYTLTPNYAGGGSPTIVFTGPGIISNIGVFSPTVAGIGTHTITCTVDLAGNCQSVFTQDVTVVGTPNIDIINLADAYCSDDIPVLISASNAGDAGTYSFSSTASPSTGNPNPLTYTAGDQSGTFNPAVDASLLSWTYYVTYTFTPSGLGAGCRSEITKPVTIYRNEAVDFSGVMQATYCQSDVAFEIEGSEAGGDFYIDGVLWGTGLTDLGGGKAEVNPAVLAVGNHTITYSYERVNPLKNCTNTRDRSFDVIDGPVGTYSVTGGGPYCLGGAGVTVSLDGSTAGVDYELYLDGTATGNIITGPAIGGQIDFNNLTALGTYTIVARQGTCERIMLGSAYVETYDLNLGINSISNVTCNGGNDGVVNLRATGGSGAYVYASRFSADNGTTWGAWTDNTHTVPNEFVGLSAGLYEFRITDLDVNAPCALDPLRYVQLTILEPGNGLSLSYTEVQKVGCNCATDPAQCDGIGAISITGGTKFTDLATYPSGYDIVWPASVTNLSADKLVASDLPAGTYNVVVTDALGCSDNIDVIIDNEVPLNLVLSAVPAVNPTANLCFGDIIAEAVVVASGGSATYEYSLDADENWLAGAATYTTPVLSTGAHTIWVRDANHPNCKASVNVNISGPATALGLNLVTTAETCDGADDGKVELQISGGVGPYEYSLDGGARAAVPSPLPELTGLATGAHTVIVYDANNCSITKSFGIDPTTPITLSGVATAVSCNGGADGKVVLTANPANVNYVYSIVKVNGVAQAPVWQASNEFLTLDSEADLSKTYTFQVMDNVSGCLSAEIDIDITQPQSFTTTHTKTDVVCDGDANGSITLNTVYADASVGAFEYSIDGGTSWQTSPINGLSSGFYTVLVKDLSSDCIVTYPTVVNISEPTDGVLSVTLVDKTDLECIGDGDGEINVDIAGGWGTYSYQWRNKDTNEDFGTAQDLNNTAASATKPVPGATYILTVTDNNGCSTTFEQIITEPLPWNITINTTPNTITNAASDAAIQGDGTANLAAVSGGSNSETYGYKWYYNFTGNVAAGAVTPGTEIAGTENATTVSNLDPGDYYIEITDLTDGCTETRNFTIGDTTVPLNVNIDFFHPECSGDDGRFEVSVLGGVPNYTIKYKRNADPQITITTGNTFTEIFGAPGSYTVIVEDSNGGSIEENFTINPQDGITISGSATFIATCQTQLSVTPVVPAGVGENYTASWTVPTGAPVLPDEPRTAADNALAITENVTIPGDYILTVKHDTKACFETYTLTVEDPTISVTEDLSRHKNVSCNGGLDAYLAVDVTGREPGHVFNYVWQNTTTAAAPINTGNRNTLGDAEDVDAGEWEVMVETFDGTCIVTIPLQEVTQPNVFDIKLVTPNHVNSCANDNVGSLLVELEGGTMPYSVTVTDGTTPVSQTLSSSTFTFNGLLPGNYTVTAQDANNCGLPAENATIDAPDPIVVTNFTGTIDCDPNDNGVISFNITGGVQAPGNISRYALIIEGDNGFSYSDVLDVDWDTEANPYSYSFNNGAGLAPATYTVKLWDANANAGTNVTCPIPVFEQSTTLGHIYISGDVTPVTCSGGNNDGAISNVTITGASVNTSFDWMPKAVPGFDYAALNQSNIPAGVYTLTFTDTDRPCDVVKVFTVDDGHTLSISSFSKSDVSCYGGSDGRIELTASPAAGNFVYSIDNGTNWQSSNVFEGLSSDDPVGTDSKTYQALVRDLDYGCISAVENIVIDQSPEITIGAATKISDITCIGESDAVYQADASDGVGGTLFEFAIELNGSGQPIYQDSPIFSGLSSGTYHLWVRRKGTSCTAYQADYITVAEPTNGALSVVLDAATSNLALDCYGDTDGVINVDVSGGWGAADTDYTYEWRNKATNAVVSNNQDISGQPAGTYVLTVTDNNGGCSTIFEQSITSPLEWDVSISTTDNTIPNTDSGATGNGTATLSPVSGGSIPATYEFDWYLADGTLISSDKVTTALSDLDPGDYYVIVTGGVAGCDKQIDFTIGDTSKPLAITVTPTDAACNGELGTLRVTMTSGTPPYAIAIQQTGYPSITVSTSNSTYLFENLLPGIYNVRVEDALTGVVTDTKEIKEPAAFNLSGDIAYDLCLAELTLDISVVDDYLVTWTVPTGAAIIGDSDINGDQVIEPGISMAGEYIANVLNKNTGCSDSYSFIVVEPSFTIIENVAQRRDVSCYGAADGYISVTAVGREPGHLFTYEWTNGTDTYNTGTVPSIGSSHPVIAGTWSVTVTTADGKCSQTLPGIVIDQPTALVINTINKTDITTCNGDDSGQLEVIVSGGSGTYYLDYTGDNLPDLTSTTGTFTVNNLVAGNYQLRVSDSNGCQTSPVEETVTINQPDALTITIDDVNTFIDCEIDGTGQIQFAVTGGNKDGSANPSYEILLTGKPVQTVTSEGTVSYSNLDAGIYTIVVKDNLASTQSTCTVAEATLVLELLTITGVEVPNACASTTNNVGAIRNINIQGASAPDLWEWDEVAGDAVTDNTQLNQENLPAGTYVLKVDDPTRGCIVTKTFTIGELNTLDILGNAVAVTCNGANDGKISGVTIIGTANYDYLWTGPGVVDNTRIDAQENLSPGIYNLTITDKDNGCSFSKSWTITEPTPITYTLDLVVESCAPYQRGINVVNPQGGNGSVPADYTYSWVGPDASLVSGQNLSGLVVGGTYSVTVSDGTCELTQSIVVPEEVQIFGDVTELNCNGSNAGAFDMTVTGGSGNFTYEWEREYPTGTFTSVETGIDISTIDISGQGPGKYTLTLTDNSESDGGGACEYSWSYELLEPSAMVINGSVTNLICNGDKGGQIAINVTGGAGDYSYNWTTADGSGLIATNQNQTGLTGGTYSVVVTDGKGCVSAIEDFTVVEPDAVDFTYIITPTDCDGTNGAITITPSGGSGATPVYGYYWSASNGGVIDPAKANDQNQSGLPGGTYLLRVWDADPGENRTGCFVEKEIVLTKAITLDYDVTNQGCAGTENGQIDLTVSGGVGPYTFAWTTISGNNAKIIPNAQNQSGLSAGEYRVRVTDSRTPASCWVEETIIVGLEVDIQANANISNVSCFGGDDGAISLPQVTGGTTYQFLWTGPSGSNLIAGQRNQSGLIAGEYRVVIIDVTSGCSVENVYTVDQPDEIIITLDNLLDVECTGQRTGEIEVSVTGGVGPYKYQWIGPDPALVQDVTIQTNLVAGDYSLVVVDDNGCNSATLNVTINEPADALVLNWVSTNNVSANGGNDGSITVSVAGGTGNKTITWTGVNFSGTPIGGIPQNTVNPTGLVAGEYTVTVVDDKGCSVSIADIIVSEPDMALTMSVSKKDIQPCNGANNGEISVTALGGMAPYTITLFNSGGSVIRLVNADALIEGGLVQDVYTIVVTDNNGTVITQNVNINEPAALSINVTDKTDVTCNGANTGTITYRITGGEAAAPDYYKVIVSGAGSFNQEYFNVEANRDYTISNRYAGDYSLTVIDNVSGNANYLLGENCSASTNVNLTQPEAVVTIANDASICNGESTTLQLTVSNYPVSAANPLEVTLSDGSVQNLTSANTTITVNPSVTTVYSVSTVEDAGCNKGGSDGSEATVVVNQLPSANISLMGADEICEGESAQFRIRLVEGERPWTVVYNDGAVNTTLNITATDTVITVSPLTDRTYTLVSVNDGNCNGSVSGSVSITVNELPSVSMAIDPANSTICYGGSSELIFTFPTGSPDYKVTYSEGGVAKTVNAIPLAGNQFTLPVSPLETTEYQLLSVKDANGCDVPFTDGTRITVNVIQNPEDAGTIIGDMIVCQGSTQSYSVDPITGADSYEWTVPPAVGSILTGNGTTTITVLISDTFTGSANIEVKGVRVNPCPNSGVASRLVLTAAPLPGKASTPTGPISVCEGEVGMRYSINPVANANTYVWTIPEGLEFVGDHDGTEIVVNVKAGYNNFTGEIRAMAVNACGDGEVSDALLVTVNPLPVANAGTDETGVCGNTHQLNAIDPGAGYTGRWTVLKGTATIDAGEENLFNANISGISQGENTFLWTVTDNITGCSSSDEVTLWNDEISVSVSASQTSTCDGTVVVTGSAIPADAQSGFWTITSGGGNVSTPVSPNVAVITDLAPGLNTIEWTVVKNACESKASINVMNNVPTEPQIFDNSGAVASIIDLACQSDATSISATAPLLPGETGTWNVVAGSATIAPNANATSINLSNLPKGETTLTWTIQNGACTKVATVTIRNNALNVFAGDDVALCGDAFTLDATIPAAGVTGQWSIPAGQGIGVFANGTNPKTEVTGLGRGDNTLRWTLTKNGCPSFDEIVITNNSATQATVGAEQIICSYETVLTGNTPSAAFGETGFWSVIQGSAQFDDVNKADTDVKGLAHGVNILRWTIQHNGCSSYADLKITNLHVDVFAGKDTIICGKTVTLNANTPDVGDVGEWSLISGVGGGTFKPSDKNNSTILMGGLDYGANGFVWTITHAGCTSSDSIFVINDNPYYTDTNGDRREVSAGDPIFVNGSTAVMVADAPEVGAGIWSLVSGGGELVDPTDAGTIVNNLRRGESVFRWTVSNGICSYSSDVTITNGSIEEANAGRNDTTCTGEIILSANEPINALGEWSVIEGAGAFDDKTKFNTTVRGMDEGENHFVWTLYNGSTQSKDTVIIVNNVVAQAYAGLDKPICNTDEFELSAIAPVAGRGVAQWSVVSGSGTFDDDTSPSTYIRGLSQGKNTLKYRISLDNCYSEAYVTITNNTPTVPDAGEDRTICVDSLQLLPNTPAYGVGEWTVESGYAQPDALEKDWAKRIAPGENKFVWTINNNNCTLSDTVTVINNQPDVANAGEDITDGLCVDHTFLSAGPVLSGRGIGQWELVAGSGTITDPADPKSEVTGLGLGVNRFRWVVDNNGCISTDEVNISNNFIEAIAGNDQVLCADTATLKANSASPGIGTWGVEAGSGSATFDDPSNPFTKVRGLQQGDNVLTWTVNYGGCSNTSKVTITNDNPSTAFAGDNQALCNSTSTILNANDPAKGTGEWTILNGSANFSSMAVNNPSVSDLAFGDNIFRWTVTNNACVSVSDVMVSYNRIEADAGSLQDLCSDETQLEGNTANPGVGTWSVVGGTSQATFEDVNNPNSKVSNLAKGANLLRWTINYRGCETFSEVRLNNNSPSTAYAGNLQEICEDNTVLDATAPSPGVGQWEVIMGSGTIADPDDPKSAVSSLSKGDNVFRWTVSNGICTSSDEIRVINNEPSVPYPGADEEVCYNYVQLKAEAPLFGAGLWTIDEGGGNFDDPTLPTATISNLKPGDNVLKWTITQGQCEYSKTITVSNNAADIAHAGPDIEDCNDWSQLDANKPQDGLYTEAFWTLVSGKGDFDDETDAKTTIRNLGFGENILMWTIKNGDCFTSDQVTIFNKIPDQSAAGDDRTTCDDYIVLNANEPIDGVGSWSVVSGSGTFEDASKHNTMVTDVGYGENVYQWTIAYGDCTTEDKVKVTSNKANPYAGEDDVTYEPDYAMQAQNPGKLTGEWTIIAGGGEFDDPNFFNTTVRNLPVGKSTFRWTISTDGCEAFDDVIIEYKEVPEAGFNVDKEQGCYPLTVKFTNYSVGGSSYTWDFGNGESITTTDVGGPEYTYEDAGTYTAVLTVGGPDGNDAIFTQRIIVHDHPTADFDVGPAIVYLPQDEIRCYDLSIDAKSWFWEFGDGQTSEQQNPSYTYRDEGVYTITLTVRNQHGCENSFSKEDAIEAHMSGFVEFPTAFRPRPGGAGNSGTIGERNDAIFKPKHRDVEQYQIQIFNRWGQLIYESNDIDEGWDGNFKGQLTPQAVYVYKVSGKYTNGREFNKAGSVLLVR